MWINVPSVFVYELRCMTEQIHIMKSTLEKLQVEIDALMETIKEQNSNLKSMKWELYRKHKEKDETKLKLNNLEEKLRKKEMQLQKVERINLGVTKGSGFSVMEYVICELREVWEGNLIYFDLRLVCKSFQEVMDKRIGCIKGEDHPRNIALKVGDVVASLRMNESSGHKMSYHEKRFGARCWKDMKNSLNDEILKWSKSEIFKCVVIKIVEDTQSARTLACDCKSIFMYTMRPLLPKGVKSDVIGSIEWGRKFVVRRETLWRLRSKPGRNNPLD